MARLNLPGVTLCAATSVNIEATVEALRASMEQVDFGDAVLLTDRPPERLPEGLRAVAIPRIRSGRDYSTFMLRGLADHIRLPHCLVVQWDGFVIHADRWDPDFLKFDYVGAPWPQFEDGHDVGNGGFSLRSKRLLEACRQDDFVVSHPEDVAIGRVNRERLEQDHAIRFADRAVAERFSFERTAPQGPTFGFHGAFNMIQLIGPDAFWSLYRGLDDRTTIFADFASIADQLRRGRSPVSRLAGLSLDRLRRRRMPSPERD